MDMSYLKDMPIAVLGGGAVGKTMAADCALAGKEVRIWDQPDFAKRNFLNIEKTGITLAGHQFSFSAMSARARRLSASRPTTWPRRSRARASLSSRP